MQPYVDFSFIFIFQWPLDPELKDPANPDRPGRDRDAVCTFDDRPIGWPTGEKLS